MSEFIRQLAKQFDTDAEPYGWVITKDHLYDPSVEGSINDAGRKGPSDISAELSERLKAGEGREFRMYDDDGQLYYTGRILTPETPEGGRDEDFGPLSDFGRPAAGASEIRYFNKVRDVWEAL